MRIGRGGRGEIETEMAAQVVKVRRETLEACMTCPLCNKLLREATTISLCLHTFCGRCIYKKLSDEGEDCCPVCDIELGCLPLDKLRPDHNLQDIRAKIFPFKRIKNKASEVMPSVSPPAKRKERSLSSLVVNTPKVSMQTGLTGKRTKVNARRAAALRGCNFTADNSIKKEDSTEDHPSSSSSPDSSSKVFQNKKQPCSEEVLKEDKDGVEILESKADLWTPLNCLVEAANRTKSSKLNPQGGICPKPEAPNAPNCQQYIAESKDGAESPHAPDGEACVLKSKPKEHAQNKEVPNDMNRLHLLQKPVKRRRLRAAARAREAPSKEQGVSRQPIVDVLGTNWDRRNSPIWFSLVPSEDQKGDASLPQISSCYLRIKDGKMPVSFIQKYLVKKLNLVSETEVEILCRGQPVLPTLQLHNLVDLWFRTASTSKKVPASVGSSAKDFVMVLSYCRKVEAP